MNRRGGGHQTGKGRDRSATKAAAAGIATIVVRVRIAAVVVGIARVATIVTAAGVAIVLPSTIIIGLVINSSMAVHSGMTEVVGCDSVIRKRIVRNGLGGAKDVFCVVHRSVELPMCVVANVVQHTLCTVLGRIQHILRRTTRMVHCIVCSRGKVTDIQRRSPLCMGLRNGILQSVVCMVDQTLCSSLGGMHCA